MSPKHFLLACALAVGAPLAAPSAAAQISGTTSRELVVASDGQLVSPWIAREACVTGTTTCKAMIVNPVTHEIARLGDQLNSRFEATGNGQEIRRAEPAIEKAARLSQSQ